MVFPILYRKIGIKLFYQVSEISISGIGTDYLYHFSGSVKGSQDNIQG
jgi:hypothetical protein